MLQTDDASSHGLHIAIEETIKQRFHASREALQTDKEQTLVLGSNRPHPYRRSHGATIDIPATPSATNVNPMPSTSSNAEALASPGTSTVDWTKLFTPDVRFLLVHRLVKALSPTPEPEAMSRLVACAEKIEENIFEIAGSRTEYYSLLGEKIFMENLQKRQRKLEEQRHVVDEGASTSTVSSAPLPSELMLSSQSARQSQTAQVNPMDISVRRESGIRTTVGPVLPQK